MGALLIKYRSIKNILNEDIDQGDLVLYIPTHSHGQARIGRVLGIYGYDYHDNQQHYPQWATVQSVARVNKWVWNEETKKGHYEDGSIHPYTRNITNPRGMFKIKDTDEVMINLEEKSRYGVFDKERFKLLIETKTELPY